MTDILKSDFYRFRKCRLFYGLMVLTALIAFSLIMLIRKDINLSISVFGNITAFKAADDIVRIGLQYQKGLGLFAAILLSVFIGQEYQWKTWQHKWITGKSRSRIYLSKVAFSVTGSAIIFLIYEMIVLFGLGQLRNVLTKDYTVMILCGLFIYGALGSVICLLSMLIKNSTTATIACLCYVLFGETLASVLGNIGRLSVAAGQLVTFGIRHSVYGMSTLVSGPAFSAADTIGIVFNSLAVMVLSTAFGVLVFRRYEL